MAVVSALGAVGSMTSHAQIVRAYVPQDSVTVGDRFTLVVVAEHTVVDSVAFPVFAAEAGKPQPQVGDLLVLRPMSAGRKLLGPGHTYPIADSTAYEVTTFALDTAFVAPITVAFLGASQLDIASAEFFVPVVSLVEEGAQAPRDIAPLGGFPAALWPWFVLLAIGLAIAGLVYYMRRPAAEVEEEIVVEAPPPPRISPILAATRRLDILEETDLEFSDSIKPFFVELTDIIRHYLSDRLGIAAMENTSREVIDGFRTRAGEKDMPAELVEDLSSVFETADLAKFADYNPGAEASLATVPETRVLLLRIEEAIKPRKVLVIADDIDSDNGQAAGEAATVE